MSNDEFQNSQMACAPVERRVIREILEREIKSYCKRAERNAANKAFDAAAGA